MSDRFCCAECAAEFANESEMLRHVSEPHVQTHSGEKTRMATPPYADKQPTRAGREFTRSPRQ